MSVKELSLWTLYFKLKKVDRKDALTIDKIFYQSIWSL